MNRLRRLLGFGIPALVAGMLFVPNATAQEIDPEDVPSVGVLPVGTKTDDPNSGQWFIAALAAGQSKRFVAGITNPALIPQRVKLYLADLDFTGDGAPAIAEQSDDVGTWGAVEQQRVEVPPRGQVNVGFTITAPTTADPGDHLGVLVAEGEPAGGGNVKVIKRVATRIYITMPGDAQPGFSIQEVTTEKDSSFFTREITTTVILRNTGRVRLSPTVLVNGVEAAGPDLIMSRSLEQWVATTKVPIWGGPQNVHVEVRTKVADRDGPFREARKSVLVVPWIMLIGLVVVIALVLLVRRSIRRRGGRYAEMRADMKRIERLLAEQRAGAPIDTREDDPELAIKAAIKRAGRAGDKDAEEQLKEKLAEHRAAKAPVEVAPPPVAAPPPSPLPEPAPAPEPVVPVASGQDTDAYDWLKQDTPADHGPADAPPQELAEVLQADDPPAAEPPRVPVQTPTGPGYFVPDPAPVAAPEPQRDPVAEAPAPPPAPPVAAPAPAPAAESRPSAEGRDEKLAAILRELATAPKRKQEPLIQAARSYGVLTLRAHGDLVEQLPADVRAKLVPKRAVI